MPRSKFTTRPTLDERMVIAVTEEQKREAFDAANKRGIPLSEFVRSAIAKAARTDADQPLAA